MPSQTDVPSRRMRTRLAIFYATLIAIASAVVIVVVSKGATEKAQPSIAGGYDASAPNPCLGPAPLPPGGAPLPATAPAQARPTGPSFSLTQSGQFVGVTNNQSTLGGQLRLHPGHVAGGGVRLTGTVDCIKGSPQRLEGVVVSGSKGQLRGTLGATAVTAVLKRDPPNPGAALPRTPSGIAGAYALSPRSTCFGGSLTLSGSGRLVHLSAGGSPVGEVRYSPATGAVSGDVACTKGGRVRVTATANDLQLQNMQAIPLEAATPVTATGAQPGARPALTTSSGLPPSGETFTATRQRGDFNRLVAAFFLAVVIVLIVARAFGRAAVWIGQPRVMGEVIAGIALGPSVLGAVSPNLQAAIFPTDTLTPLGVAANLGLIFFMFLVGLEVDLNQLRGRASRAAAISNASVTVPLLLGIAAALPLYRLIGPHTRFVAFALYMGVAMSITAFPVLARILAERRMLSQPVGALTIACAAADDLTAWFLIALAGTIAASGSFGEVARTIGEAVLFTLLMVLVVRPLLGRMATAFDEVGRIPSGWFAAILVGVLLSAYVTEMINIAFIFGGFIMGAVMPRHAGLSEDITRRIDDFVVTLLLPIFFVYTGLKTNVTLLDRPELWLITVVLIALAIIGKLAGAAVAARVTGFDWRASAVIGTLMNTRGLTELIVLNLALTAGAISGALFAALVLMALVTTLMAGPMLRLLDPRGEFGAQVEDDLHDAARDAAREHPGLTVPDRSILVAPQTDAALDQLVALAAPLAHTPPPHELIIVRLVAPPRGAGVRAGLQSENVALRRASRTIDEARSRLANDGLAARGVAVTSSAPAADIVHIVSREAVDLVLIDGRRRLVGDGVPLGEVSAVLRDADCDAAVLIARDERAIHTDTEHPVLVPFGGAEHDWAALELASWIASRHGAPLKLLGAAGQTADSRSVTRTLADAGLIVQQSSGVRTEPVVVTGGRDGIVAAARGAGLLVIGLSDRWRREGLGPTRSEIAKAAPAPVLFVRRGRRAGLFASRQNLTGFNWSMADRPSVPAPARED